MVGQRLATAASPTLALTIDALFLDLLNQPGQSRLFRFKSANAQLAGGVRAVSRRQPTRRAHCDHGRFRQLRLVHEFAIKRASRLPLESRAILGRGVNERGQSLCRTWTGKWRCGNPSRTRCEYSSELPILMGLVGSHIVTNASPPSLQQSPSAELASTHRGRR
jgi:hypothetical protein